MEATTELSGRVLDSIELCVPKTSSMVALSEVVDKNESGNVCMMGRKRAHSVASPPTVENVIVKAKRAASSLWMLLHSQVRRVKVGESFESSLY
jgi:hypothetical protein